MLERIRILQIGDIHFPETASLGLPVDDKDATFPREMKNGLSRYPLKTVFRRIHDMLAFRNKPPKQTDCVLFMGDATSYGDLKGYQNCVEYIASCLQLGKTGAHSHIPFGAIPGNHDINRPLVEVPGSDERFNALNKALNSVGLPFVPVHDHVAIELKRSNCTAKVILLNSCMGCGLKKHIPPAFRKALSEAIKSEIGGVNAAEALKQYFDLQLDTPTIEQSTLDGLSHVLTESPKNEMVVISAHHNLLPQRSLRFAPYTELVNSGVIRDMLQNAKRPVVYLHGHIHDDPVELLKSPDGYPVVFVSSRRVDEGFNVVEIVFDSTGKPICCNISPYRFQKNKTFERSDEIRVPLINSARAYSNPLLAQTYSAILALQTSRLEDIRKKLPRKTTLDVTAEQVEILAASGLAVINGYGSPYENWIVEGLTK